MEYVLTKNFHYVVELLVSTDNFYIIDYFNLQMDILLKYIDYTKLYYKDSFNESFKNIDYLIELYLDFKNEKVIPCYPI